MIDQCRVFFFCHFFPLLFVFQLLFSFGCMPLNHVFYPLLNIYRLHLVANGPLQPTAILWCYPSWFCPVSFLLWSLLFNYLCWFHHPWDKLQLTRPFIIRPLRVFLVSFVKLPLPTFHPVGLFAFSPCLCTLALCSLGMYVHWYPLYQG